MLATVRRKAPLVHCITNYVAMNIAANVLLAVGASPAMIHSTEEAAEFAALADGLTINIGTLSPEWLTGMKLAARAAVHAKKPWVLDPVAHHATAFRRRSIAELLDHGPTVIRGNASEIITLGGGQSTSKGVDANDTVELAQQAAITLARHLNAVVAVTGSVDFVTDGKRAARLVGGSTFMPQVTALGCSLTCLIGAFSGAHPHEPFDATVAALACFNMAGEKAALVASGPGSFAWQFIDALAALDEPTLDRWPGLSVVSP